MTGPVHAFGHTWTEAPEEAPEVSVTPPKCSACQRDRTIRDAYDYNPLQVVTGLPLGWYSGDDGEICPECMTKMMRGNR